MGRSGCPTRGGTWMGPSANPKVWTSPFCWMSTPNQKIESLRPCPDNRPHIGKKVSPIAFRQILRKILPVPGSFSNTSMTYLKRLVGTKSLNTKQCPAGLSPRIVPPVSSFLPKCLLLWCCFVSHTRCGLSPLSLNLCGKPLGWQAIPPNRLKFTHLPPEKSSLINLDLPLSKVSCFPHQIATFM